MSSIVKSTTTERTVRVDTWDGNQVILDVAQGDRDARLGLIVYAADLIEALRAEGIIPAEPKSLAEWGVRLEVAGPGYKLVPADAVVIEAGDSMDPGPDMTPKDGAADSHLRLARYHVRCAEWHDAHPPKPPVDEAAVKALTDLVEDAPYYSSDDLARRLYLAGVRIDTEAGVTA